MPTGDNPGEPPRPSTPNTTCKYALITPTKRAVAVILHEDCEMSFRRICERTPFKRAKIKPRALAKAYLMVKDHDGDCYANNRKNCGWKKIIPDEEVNEAVRRIDEGELIDGEDVRKAMWPDRPARTVRHVLINAGLPGHAQRQKLPLLARHIEGRETMFKKFEAWTNQRVFEDGVWLNSDETKIMLGSSDGRRWCQERHGRFNLKINVWGVIHPNGVGELIRVEGNLTAVQYVDILERGLLDLYDHYENHRHTFLYFQQDNNPKHTSRLAKAWLRDKQINVFPWPAKSPDLSPIENVWAELKRRICSHPRFPTIQTTDKLFEVTQEVWKSDSFGEYAKVVYRSFPRRLQLLKENKFMWID
ncbi:DDE-3 domain-containing protein [Mycena venus]|uniref:DDE-3 domain-containing protein n=1 Tax=Mycena venus TaxID=2733690 RepID=A0A8H6X9F3_9AGAR|nr:DDE-3 domain-containing protein [Mycena venus]